MNELITLSACELLARMHSGALTPLQVVDAHIERIQAVNPVINALVTPIFEQARREALQAGEQIARQTG